MKDLMSSKNVQYFAAGIIVSADRVKEYENDKTLRKLSDFGMATSLEKCLEDFKDVQYVEENVPHLLEEDIWFDGTMTKRISIAVVNPEYLQKLEKFYKENGGEEII